MRLNVDVLGAEEFFGAFDREILHHVDEFTAAVIAAAGVAFCVLVGEDRAGRFQHGLVSEVFRSDQLQAVRLSPRLVLNRGIDFRVQVLERHIDAIHEVSST